MADPVVLEKHFKKLHDSFLGEDEISSRDWWSFLTDNYEEERRYYHTLSHPQFMFELLRECDHLVKCKEALSWAVWFHDVFYFTKPGLNGFNEELSAKAAVSDPRLTDVDRYDIHRFIMATDHMTIPVDDDEKMIHDLDLTILGRIPEIYKVYTTRIRREFVWVPDSMWRVGRGQILRNFLSRDRIYLTDYWHDLQEEQARENIQRELDLVES